jgi:3-methyladenine DNA glycosylase AlkD
MSLIYLKRDLKSKSNPEKAKVYQKFFKTGVGEYGEGDVFLGLNSQEIKDIAQKYYQVDLEDLQKLLEDKVHECRMSAARILVNNYKKDKENTFRFYVKNAKKFNNWDLVDVSCHKIVGDFLLDKDRKVLYKLANSKNLWKKRIAIVSTYAFIRENDFDDTLKISEILLGDSHDLIHKAVGWMLREVGKKDENVLKDFLKKNYSDIPRTTLRYAIEKLPEDERKKYLRGEI